MLRRGKADVAELARDLVRVRVRVRVRARGRVRVRGRARVRVRVMVRVRVSWHVTEASELSPERISHGVPPTCNRGWRRLQPYVAQVATVAAQAVTYAADRVLRLTSDYSALTTCTYDVP